jgi:hypothetical protein
MRSAPSQCVADTASTYAGPRAVTIIPIDQRNLRIVPYCRIAAFCCGSLPKLPLDGDAGG